MKKLLKSLLAFVLACGCFTVIPAKAETTTYKLDRTNWTGDVVQSDGADRDSGSFSASSGTDLSVKPGMFDESESTLYHSNDGSWEMVTMPCYITIDFNDTISFSSMTVTNRSNGDGICEYEIYINNGETTLGGSVVDGSYTLDEGWEKIASTNDEGYNELANGTKNTVDFGQEYQAKQMVVKVLSTYNSKNTPDVAIYLTCNDFALYTTDEAYAPATREGELDRTGWKAYSYNSDNVTEYQHKNPNEGDPNYLLDGNLTTWWHTSWNNNDGQTDKSEPPYYVVIDMKEAKTLDAFLWINRGFKGLQYGANGIVENFNFYYTTDDAEETKPLNDAGTIDTEKWTKATIKGVETDTDAKMEWHNDEVNNLFYNYINLNEEINARKVLIEVKSTINSYNNNHGSGVEFKAFNSKNIALNKTAITSGTDGYGNVAAYAFDGNAGTRWCGQAIREQKVNGADLGDAWLGVDLGETKYSYDTIKLTYDAKACATKYDIQVSDNGVSWTTVKECITNNGDDSNRSETVELDAAQTARYVRIYVKEVNANAPAATSVSIKEMEVLGYEIEKVETSDITSVTVADGTVVDTNKYVLESKTDAGNKYVSKDVLGIKAQAKKEDNGTYSIRFVSSVASTNPDKVGFKVTVSDGTPGNTKTKELETTTVFEVIAEKTSGDTIYSNASAIFNKESQFFFTANIINVADTDEVKAYTIEVTPYWVVDGTTVYGQTGFYKIADLAASAPTSEK